MVPTWSERALSLNDVGLLSDSGASDIEYQWQGTHSKRMKKLMIYTVFALSILTVSASAECYADYKAKKDNPLQLHYGVVELADRDCRSSQAAGRAIASRLSADGWTLLNIVSIFDRSELEQRRASAGQYFLRY